MFINVLVQTSNLLLLTTVAEKKKENSMFYVIFFKNIMHQRLILYLGLFLS